MQEIKISYMSFDACVMNSRKLAEAVLLEGFNPSYVLGIARGGLLPAREISLALNRPLASIQVERPLRNMKESLGLKRLPREAKTILRRLEMATGLYRRLGRRTIRRIEGALGAEPCLVVDDSLDTGKTVATVVEYLTNIYQMQRQDIRIAVITQMYEDANPPSDYCLFRNVNFCFPWSLDSQEYTRFLEYIEGI